MQTCRHLMHNFLRMADIVARDARGALVAVAARDETNPPDCLVVQRGLLPHWFYDDPVFHCTSVASQIFDAVSDAA